jgi:phosphoribosylformylglycinamidine synthase
VYVEKRPDFDVEARRIRGEISGFLGTLYPDLARLGELRLFHRYDVRGLTGEQFSKTVRLVLSEPQCDEVYYDFPGEVLGPAGKGAFCFGVEYLRGQYDQRSDSAEQCAELVVGLKPSVKTARVYLLKSPDGPLSPEAEGAVKRYLINPVDSRECGPADDAPANDAPAAGGGDDPEEVPVLEGFREAADPAELIRSYGFAMSPEDLACCRAWFTEEGRDPSLAEMRILDTYWSDHCRHTTFNTELRDIVIGQGPLASALEHALGLYEAARREVYGPASGPVRSLMDLATIGARVLKKRNAPEDLDESGEINACSLRVTAEFGDGVGGSREPWLLFFKNETHNHPTEIEPFGGAATCLGGAIRDPLSGRAYVHQAMRISGGADPRVSVTETLPGKLPQLRIAREAAAGYSSYGNQIGLATGQVAEFYHPGFLAKRLELGAVLGAVPEAWVRREEPAPGDLVLLVGGKTGRDGIGGATGSSRVHTGESVETAGAEVQKGNAVEERKLQRLFRNPGFTLLVKRCNDFGAGGVAVAVGELAAGLDINLDGIPKKYAGLNGIELAISESQERMAVVCAPGDADTLIGLAAAENLDAVVIAVTNADPAGNGNSAGGAETARLRMSWRGKTIADLSRRFLNSNGAPRSAAALLPAKSASASPIPCSLSPDCLLEALEKELASLRCASRRGLQERFDGSIGALSVLFPWGGREQGTPECGMASLLPSLEKPCRTASLMTFGCDPELLSRNPYEGAKGSIREALAKFACLGGDPRKARLSLQEYFERALDPESWGRPAAALLGALEAQLRLGVSAIGGKDSMSGTYRDEGRGIELAVPPTLVAFAAGTTPARKVRSGALSGEAGNPVILLNQSPPETVQPARDEWETFTANMKALAALGEAGLVRAAWPVGSAGVAASLAVMAFGNMAGLETYARACNMADPLLYQGSVLAEIDGKAAAGMERLLDGAQWIIAAKTIGEPVFRVILDDGEGPGTGSAERSLEGLRGLWEAPLDKVYPQRGDTVADSQGYLGAENRAVEPSAPFGTVPPLVQARQGTAPPVKPGSRRFSAAKSGPLVVLPVFPGTNCEWDMEKAFREAGGRTRLLVFRNRDQRDIRESTRELAAAIGEAQILALSGGFSAGDEPDGSGKFIANVLRAPAVAGAVTELLDKREGLIIGICNGFQALIKLGLVPYGEYREAGAGSPTLTFNRIGRHVSRMVRTRVMSNRSPWLALEEPGTIQVLPVSHGEGRLVIGGEDAEALFKAGQVPFCYADAWGRPTMAEPDNPNGSAFAIEGLTSPDGRVLGKMAHSERQGEFVHINIPGNKISGIFKAGVTYFG